eukprot:CAMPEP_0175644846 /NCGR_PEP_ID=MMETSP0097-20121207/6518_1 /TAXON_ID=311494 /ORGANISM="Alexandrium monilatum, Strain CCMP3105" /LENGTH=192 /DNA_ID=CAMNT_0016950729 /DNA_START=1 /DNA_END=576 /DNA_ORIENTATION=-
MEPIPLFDSPGALAATWSQTDESVTITVPLPASPASLKPEVVIRQQHLIIRCRTVPADADGEEGVGGAGGSASGGNDPVAAEPEAAPAEGSAEATVGDVRTLLDNDLSGDVTVEESAWTANDGTLIIELSKRPNYTTGATENGAPPRCPWWPCAVRGGKRGPEDPKAPPKQEPNIKRLDSKIGAQAESKKSF